MERINPSGITYSEGAIPLGTPAKSSVRKFYPKNGRDFSPTGTNVIQLPLYAEGQNSIRFLILAPAVGVLFWEET